MILATLCICLYSFYNGKNLRLLYQWSVEFLTHHRLKALPDGDYFQEERVEEEEDKDAINPAIQAYSNRHDDAVYKDCLQYHQQGLQHEPPVLGKGEPPLLVIDLDGSSEAFCSSIPQPPSLEKKRQAERLIRRKVAFQNVTIRQFVRVTAERQRPPLALFSLSIAHITQPSKATARSKSFYHGIREGLGQYYQSLEEKQQNAPILRATNMHSTAALAAAATTTRRDDWSVVVTETTVTVDEFERCKRDHYSSFRCLSHTVTKNKKSTRQQQQQQQQQKYKNKTKKKMNKTKKSSVQIMASCGARPFVLEGGRLPSASTSNRQRNEQRPT